MLSAYIRTSPDELGLTAVKYWLNNYKIPIARPFSKKFILAAISIVLKENTFHFDGKFYRQIQGTAMGNKMAPTYATLMTSYLEKELYSRYENTFGNENKDDFIKLFRKLLDHCFRIWKRSEKDLMKFYDLLNDLHEKIKFTIEKGNKTFHFLTFYYTRTEESYTRTFSAMKETHTSI